MAILPRQRRFAIMRAFARLRANQRDSPRQAGRIFQTLLHRAISP